jgi:hypothetical protein
MSKALSSSLEVPSSAGTYSAALEGLTGVNEVLMRRDPSIPPLYSTGALWEVRPGDPSELKWRYAPDVAGEGWGDCQDLSAYRAAELRVSGVDPKAHVRVYPSGPNSYHAVVARGDGSVEDPSVILGMNPIPEAPMSTSELPIVAGFPSLHAFLSAAHGGIRQALRALHPHPPVDVSGPGFLGPETPRTPKVDRIKDVAPEVRGPTFHVAPHRIDGICGWKGIHRVPLKDGTAIVGMTETYKDPRDVIGDGAGLLSSVGDLILRHPVITALVAPEALTATALLKNPSSRYALNATSAAARDAAGSARPMYGTGSDGWPSVWGAATSKRVRYTGPTGVPNQYNPGGTPNIPQMTAAQARQQGGAGATLPAGTLNPATGQPFPAGTTLAQAQQVQQQYAAQQAASGVAPGTINPMTGTPFPPGTTAMGVQAAYQAAQQQQSGGGSSGGGSGGGGYSSDYGIPDGGGGGGFGSGSGYSPGDMSDSDAAAAASFSDPTAALGYWNT